jgi:hypothetical protein
MLRTYLILFLSIIIIIIVQNVKLAIFFKFVFLKIGSILTRKLSTINILGLYIVKMYEEVEHSKIVNPLNCLCCSYLL